MKRAKAAYELLDPVKGRRGVIGTVLLLFDIWSGTGSDGAFDHQVKERRSGRIVYTVTTGSGLDYREARRSISQDLRKLTVEEFERQYGLRGRDTSHA